MKLAEFSVKNSLLVNLLSIFIIIVGIVAMLQLKREAFPNIDFDRAIITTYYPGAPSEDVEKYVTTPIEKELKGISGIKELSSISEEGRSEIGIEIDPDARDKKEVISDIEEAVDRVRDLPEEIEDDPYVLELTADEFPVVEISLIGDLLEKEKRIYAQRLEDLILDVEGVASVQRIAWRDPEIWVELDPQKMKEAHVAFDEVIAALRKKNITLPGGPLTTEHIEYSVRITGEFRTPEEIENVFIRANDAGHGLKIEDVAEVKSTFEDETYIPKVNGKRSLSMVVVKNRSGDIISVVEKVNEVLDEFKQRMPEGIETVITNDLSYYVKRRLNVLKTNAVIGLILVIVVLFLFLDPLPALMTAIGLPIAIFTTFSAMLWMGASINLVTMLGLIIVLGMLVDDGIIVAENVYRHIEEGMSPKDAAVKGTSEVIAPVTVTIMTTCAAFSPLLFMEDIMGKFIRFIPIIVMTALASSLLEAFVILPSHLADFVRLKKTDLTKRNNNKTKQWFDRYLNFYTRVVKGALRHRYIFLIGMVFLFVLAIFTAKHMKIVMFTGEGIEEFHIRGEAPKNTPLGKTAKLFEPIEALLETLPDTEIDAYRTFIGEISQERNFDPNAKRGTHLGQIRVFLTAAQSRERTSQDIADALRPKLKEIEGFEELYLFVPKEGPPVGRPIEVAIKGDNFDVLNEIADQYVKALNGIKGVTDITTSYQFGKKQMRVDVDEQRAKQYYLSVHQIASAVRAAFDGVRATQIKPIKAEEETDVLVRFPPKKRNTLNAFEDILIQNSRGDLIPLTAVAEIKEEEAAYRIGHLDGKRVVYVTAQVDEKNATSFGVNQMLSKKFSGLPDEYPGYTIKYSGEYEDQIRTFNNLLRSFIIAFLLIFIILATLFNSLVQPFVVMLAIPFGIVGVIFAFYAHDVIGRMFFDLPRPLSFFAFMGVVGLTGIVVNDSIVLVDFVNKLRRSGKERRESLIEAGRMRLRPVMMTTITTIAGLISVAYGIGGGDPFLRPMALAIVWGLFFATGLTLVVIPCIYAIIDDVYGWIFHRSTVKKNGNHGGL